MSHKLFAACTCAGANELGCGAGTLAIDTDPHPEHGGHEPRMVRAGFKVASPRMDTLGTRHRDGALALNAG